MGEGRHETGGRLCRAGLPGCLRSGGGGALGAAGRLVGSWRARRLGHAKAVRVRDRACLARGGGEGQAALTGLPLSMLDSPAGEAGARDAVCARLRLLGEREAHELRTPKIATRGRRLRARLDRLSGELKGRAASAARSRAKARAQDRADAGSAMSLGLRAGSEFVSAVIVGSGIGWVLDRALGTNPAFLIVFFLIGVAAGIWNVIRLTSPKAVFETAIRPCLARTRRIKTCGARLPEPSGTPRWGGAEPLAGRFEPQQRRGRRRGLADVATESGPAINPIQQFALHPVVSIQVAGHDVSLTNSGLFMLLAVALSCLLVAIGARGGSGVPGRMQAMAEMAYEFVAGMVRSAAGEAGMRFFPFVFSHLLFRSAGQSDRLHSLFVRGDEPDHHHRRSGADRVFHRRDHRHQGARGAFLQAVRAARRADLHPAAGGGDRGRFLPVAPGQPFGASVRQHARRPHHAQRVRQLRHHAARRRARRSRRSRCCPSW